jgi:glycosyltransferase involved in cell wall biosynthesis
VAPPLVSVIVRTMDRPVLARALAAAARQTYRPLEIVLVDASAKGLAMTEHAGVPVRVVNRGVRLPRPAAANAGVEAARGAWMMLLDEDDEIDPAHVASLVAVATAAGAGVAYSQTKLVDPAGRTVRIFGGPYSRPALRQSNYIHSNAALFSRDTLRGGIRFDEELAIFEDWDFWLQLSRVTPFAFTGSATAVYRASEGESGAGSGPNLDRDAVLATRARLMRKWGADA